MIEVVSTCNPQMYFLSEEMTKGSAESFEKSRKNESLKFYEARNLSHF